MHSYQPFSVIGFHSCEREVGLRVLNASAELKPSRNNWDWLADGIYFWEQNPLRALQYAQESASGIQFNKKAIEVPFVLGAIIDLGNCLNLVENSSLELLAKAHAGLQAVTRDAGILMPVNKGNNRALDCAVIRYIHQSNEVNGAPSFDTVRSAFHEGEEAYLGATFSSRLHIQVCVRNPECIKGFFLPRPVELFNPNL